jgi:hypothetical protein
MRGANVSEARFESLSGAAWGIAAYLSVAAAGRVWPSPTTLLLFTAVGAGVGSFVAVALRRVRLTGAFRIAAVSLCSLLAAGSAFGMALSLVAFARTLLAGLARPELLMGVLIAPIYWVWGLVATGLVLVLWPLSAVNHWWLAQLRTRTAPASQPVE